MSISAISGFTLKAARPLLRATSLSTPYFYPLAMGLNEHLGFEF